MTAKGLLPLAGLVVAAGAVIAKQVPEIQRYLKVRKM
jgi:hypothetical protein